ncbi:MAG: carboxypeptidase-like regulatory domain-containing protein [bacterium]
MVADKNNQVIVFLKNLFFIFFLVLFVFTAVSAWAMGSNHGPPGGSPPGGPSPGAGNQPGGGAITTTSSVQSDHLLGVTGETERLGLEVYPASEGIWSNPDEPSNRYNPMSVLPPLSEQAPLRFLNVENTTPAGDAIAGAMRFQLGLDFTDRYDFEGAELHVKHHNQGLLPGIHMLGRLSTANSERFHRAEFKLGGIRDEEAEPEVEQIRRLRGQNLGDYQPIWWEFKDDHDRRRRRTGIYPNLPEVSSNNNIPGYYHMNYNIRSANTEALYKGGSSDYDPLLPGVYDYIARIFTASGDTFEYSVPFTVNGLNVPVTDELDQKLTGLNVELSAAKNMDCSYFPRDLNLGTNDSGVVSVVMQPTNRCRIKITEGPVFNPVEVYKPGSWDSQTNLQDTAVIPVKQRLHGQITDRNGEPISGYTIKAEPVGNNADKRQGILDHNAVEQEVKTDGSGKYEMWLMHGQYKLTAEHKVKEKYYGRRASSHGGFSKVATTTVTLPRHGYWESRQSGPFKKRVDWQAIGKYSSILAHVKKYNKEGVCKDAQYTQVYLNGSTPLGPVSDDGGTGSWAAEALFEKLPPGSYNLEARVNWKAEPSLQIYNENVNLDTDEKIRVQLGPDKCF